MGQYITAVDFDGDEVDIVDEPCGNCGSYSHWTEKCNCCEDCKSPKCKGIGSDACVARCEWMYR